MKWTDELRSIRNKLYDSLPTGQIEPFALIIIIRQHLSDLDEYIDTKQSIPTYTKKEIMEAIREIIKDELDFTYTAHEYLEKAFDLLESKQSS